MSEDIKLSENGEKVLELEGYTTEYKVVPIPADKRSAVKAGSNTMAVHCTQRVGGQSQRAEVMTGFDFL